MSNKSGSFFKPKFSKKKSSAKSSESTVSSSLYSGIASAEHAIQNPGLTFSIPSNQLKRLGEKTDTIPSERAIPLVQHHQWESKYNQVFTREKIKKSMTKDPYTPVIHLIVHANESITTEEEYSPVLITPDAVRIDEKPAVLLGETKTVLPNIVRYVRNKVVKTSDRFGSQMSTKKSSIFQLQVQTDAPLPMIGTNTDNGASNLVATDRLLTRAKMRHDASILRRSARIPAMDTIHETISQLSVYG